MLLDLLHQQGFVILDGGLATEAEVYGANLNDPLWSAKLLLENPALLERINFTYLEAGADVSTTATYQATIPGLMTQGLTAPQAEAVIREGVNVSRRARDAFWSHPPPGRLKPLVVASIGPYGAFLHDGSEYRGHYGLTRTQLKDFHRARIAILVDAQPDLLAFESIPSQLEGEAIVELLEEFPRASCWISFTCKDGARVSEGTPLAEVAAALNRSPQVLAIGVNCVAPRFVEPLLRAAHTATDKPLVAYPNSGETYDIATCSWKESSEEEIIQESVQAWYHAGGRLLGGCCRTTPATIRALRRALDELNPNLRHSESSSQK